jgi:hypothetical protein
MTHQVRLIDYYRAIETTAQNMLDAASRHHWDEMHRLEQCCKTLINELEAQKAHLVDQSGLTREEGAERMQIMLRLVRIDGAVRHHAQPHSKILDGWLAPGASLSTGSLH